MGALSDLEGPLFCSGECLSLEGRLVTFLLGSWVLNMAGTPCLAQRSTVCIFHVIFIEVTHSPVTIWGIIQFSEMDSVWLWWVLGPSLAGVCSLVQWCAGSRRIWCSGNRRKDPGHFLGSETEEAFFG